LLYPEMLRLPVPKATTGLPGTVFHDHTGALAWLEAELANLVAAVRHAAEHGPRPAAWRLADTLRGYFWRRRHMVDWLAVAQAGLAATEGQDDLQAKAAAHRHLGLVCQCLGDYAHAVGHYTNAVALARQAGWVEGQAAVLGDLALVQTDLGQLQQAADRHIQLLALNREIGSKAGQAIALGNLGAVTREMGRLEQAADYLTQAWPCTGRSAPRAAKLPS
jgi:tetratricopeptide (TPR) repeat protein